MMKWKGYYTRTRRNCCNLGKQRTTHLAELDDFLPETVFGNLKTTGQTGNAEKYLRSAVDQFFGQRNLVRYKFTPAYEAGRCNTGLLLRIPG